MGKKSGLNRPGCLSAGGLVVAGLAVVVVAAISLIWGGVLFSPGALNAAAGPLALGGAHSHTEVACLSCHPAPWSGLTMTSACLACHTDLAQDPKNFHNVMKAQGKAVGCIQCHTDHRGPEASLTRLDTQGFPHDAAGFSLAAHQKMADGSPFKCADCHDAGLASFGQARCTACHLDINPAFIPAHVTAFGQNCLGCHDGRDSYGHAFDHNKAVFVLTGRHASLDCAQCHAGASLIAALKTTPQDCFSCHAKDDTHQGAFGKDCAQCHTPDNWQSAKVDHNQTGFPLTGKHAAAACAACHLNGVFKGTPKDCYSCHAKDDAHQGSFGQDCAQCHTPASWQSATVDHNKTAFPLTGKHLAVACTACHVNNLFKGTPTACNSCHADPPYHKGLFGLDCASCHTSAGWTPAKFNANHPFPVNHGEAGSCAACHPASLAAYTCYACHDQGQMVSRHREANVSTADLPNCARCHSNGRGGG